MIRDITVLTDLAELLSEHDRILYNSGFSSHNEFMTAVENSKPFRSMQHKYGLTADDIHQIITTGRYVRPMETALREITKLFNNGTTIVLD